LKARKTKKYVKVTFLPFENSVEVPSGISILDAVKKNGLPMKTSCGGKGTCGDCVVKILRGAYKKKSSAVLSDRLVSQGYALSCQTEVQNDLTLQLPQFQELSFKSIVDSRLFRKDRLSGHYEIDPPLKKIDLKLSSPTLEDNYSDLKRLERELRNKIAVDHLHCEYSVLKKLARSVRKSQGEISIILFKSGEQKIIIDVFPQSAREILGIACDIGTSTVALHLVDLQNGEILSSASSFNHQIKCGEDVISRINYAQKAGRLQELHDLIIGTINHLVEKTTAAARVASSEIYYASVSGNTTMTHLFLNLEPRFIREEPYVPTLNQVPLISARDVGLNVNSEARITCAPAVGSYVGGDITAGLLCTPILRESSRNSLFIDVGTNGELVLGNKDWLMTCACSAGPAFEGGGIKCGMPASAGAIEGIKIHDSGQLEYKVVDNLEPKGLCGSGLVDLLAELLIQGYIDRNGKFDELKNKEMIVETDAGKGFLIEKGQNSFWGKDLVITEKDISHLIRAKGAVYSACSVLLKNSGLDYRKIDSFYIAGGFGQHLNIENAVRIGLLPDVGRKKFHYLGNSSLLGAYLILLSDKNRDQVNKVSDKMTYLELNTEPSYMNEYTGALFLPHTDMNLFPSVKGLFYSRD
jgi:uncharacterized 2Fe-2S/4Fe-4S cluster protein (DUF4445 family)